MQQFILLAPFDLNPSGMMMGRALLSQTSLDAPPVPDNLSFSHERMDITYRVSVLQDVAAEYLTNAEKGYRNGRNEKVRFTPTLQAGDCVFIDRPC